MERCPGRDNHMRTGPEDRGIREPKAVLYSRGVCQCSGGGGCKETADHLGLERETNLELTPTSGEK